MKKLLRKDLGLVFCVYNVIFYILALTCIAMRFGREGYVMFSMVLLLAGLTVPGLIAHEQSQGRKPEQCSAETDLTAYVKEKYILMVITEAVGICAGALIWFIFIWIIFYSIQHQLSSFIFISYFKITIR